VNCGIPVNEECPSSQFCIYVGNEVKSNVNLGKCILDECSIYSLQDCSKNNGCGISEGFCVQIKNGSVNRTISGQVIGGYLLIYIILFLI
jgi:hypothetical protein